MTDAPLMRNLLAAVGWVLFGCGLWIGGWVGQRWGGPPAVDRDPGPDWLRSLCGVPAGGRGLDRRLAVLQLSGLAAAVAGAVCAFVVPWGPPYQAATLAVFFGALLPYAVVAGRGAERRRGQDT